MIDFPIFYINLLMQNSNNPLHGITLQKIIEFLVAHYGYETLGKNLKMKCFIENPSINSSLKFLRKTDWARQKVEKLYLKTIKK
ncbi:hypothetical protein FB1_08330 [Flavobacterium branchiophilum NBRC 15030 = ATCC 35035]|uniref:Uncharacterized protein DUF2132 n=2 Tax=Flavobacterium branchiophilum TaxID=55197 RepID=A0A543G8M0_9FLAO|nr:uncharacterized protein DUF2132 [Flavobacterium branchiophilum]GEM54612.1 hypothetical protein FB1_08330 [Flavobacterium branchiophilum NBRC 15030 = ATCC 35035]